MSTPAHGPIADPHALTPQFQFLVHYNDDIITPKERCEQPHQQNLLYLRLYTNDSLQTNYSPVHGHWFITDEADEISVHWDPFWRNFGLPMTTWVFKRVPLTDVWQRCDDESAPRCTQYLIPMQARHPQRVAQPLMPFALPTRHPYEDVFRFVVHCEDPRVLDGELQPIELRLYENQRLQTTLTPTHGHWHATGDDTLVVIWDCCWANRGTTVLTEHFSRIYGTDSWQQCDGEIGAEARIMLIPV